MTKKPQETAVQSESKPKHVGPNMQRTQGTPVDFKCNGCGRCCSDLVATVTPHDVRRIARETGMDPHDFVEWATPDRFLNSDNETSAPWIVIGDKRYLMTLQQSAQRGCVFLVREGNSTRCSIYKSRPVLCRTYPYDVEFSDSGQFKSVVLREGAGCHLPTGKLTTVEDIQHLLALTYGEFDHDDEYAALVEKFNAMDYPNKQPYDIFELFL